jgi:hypothetical protein
MQTSFMHPPFGFALFYLRGISDTLHKNGSLPRKLASNDIYMGAIPWVLMQLVLVAVVIAFPQTVTVFLDKEKAYDPDAATQMLQDMGGGRAEPAASSSATPADDAMEAVRRAIGQDKKP